MPPTDCVMVLKFEKHNSTLSVQLVFMIFFPGFVYNPIHLKMICWDSCMKYIGILLTLQHLKQIWSRRLFKHINKNLKLLKTLRYICHIILKTLLPKEILLSLSNISFGHNVFKSCLLQWRLYASPGDKELTVIQKRLYAL